MYAVEIISIPFYQDIETHIFTIVFFFLFAYADDKNSLKKWMKKNKDKATTRAYC